MSRTRVAGLLAAALLFLPVAHAQSFRAYLASTGSDANPCTLAAPCRLLPAALTAVASGGEIWMLDSANYNTAPVSITKSVSILAVPGVLGSVVGMGGEAALLVQTAGTKVSLRNLRVVPFPGTPTVTGVTADGNVTLSIDGGVIAGFQTSGVAASGGARLHMNDAVSRDNGGDGVLVYAGASGVLTRVVLGGNGNSGARVSCFTCTTTRLSVIDSTLQGNGTGIEAAAGQGGGSTAILGVQGSLVAGNATEGIRSVSLANLGIVKVTAHGNTIANNAGKGIASSGTGARVSAASNNVVGNAYGFHSENGGVITTVGTNMVRENGTNKMGTIDTAAMD